MQHYPVAHIDLAALQHNLARVKQLAPNSRVMAAIKADAYGHGMIKVAQALAASDAFCVARLAEAIALRQAGISHPIVILEGVNTEQELQLAADNSLSIVISSELHIELAVATTLSQPLPFCWLMLETGMHRLGLPLAKVDAALHSLAATANIAAPIGLMSHFASADLINDPRNQQQLSKFNQCTQQYPTLPTSIANSAAICSLANSHSDWVRPGIMLYGSSPFADQTAGSLQLKPVMRLTSLLIAIHTLQAGDQLGYGGDWTASQLTRVGIVGMGYGDGYPYLLSNIGSVLIDNKRVAILGRISMDMIAIDLSQVKQAKIGSEVTLWGCEQLSVDTVAKTLNTVSYQLLSQITSRVIRHYHYG